MTDSKFAGLAEFRCIGPFRGGRVVAVAGDRARLQIPSTSAASAAASGRPLMPGNTGKTSAMATSPPRPVGALEVAPADPNVIYAGTGETTIRIDVSIGDGMYKSTDAGRSWAHIGLKDTRQIAKIRTHPQNADLVYVAAFGHAFGRELGAWRLPLERWRRHLAERPACQRQSGRH